jgi:hypothetical protein
MSYASEKNAFGISDRSGRRYRLRDMKVEWTGAKVGPDEYEPKHPQLYPPNVGSDPQALRNPRPETGLEGQRSIQYGWNPVGFRSIPGISPSDNLEASTFIGQVVIQVGGSSSGAIVLPTGVSAAGEINGVVVVVAAVPSFDSTSTTLDSTADTFDEG